MDAGKGRTRTTTSYSCAAKTRQCVYISRDVHGKILRIVNDIAGGEISVGGYVDTVLRQHLEQHKERINELYKKQREDLI